MNEPFDPRMTLAQIAAVAPSAASTRRAVARAAAVLQPARRTRRLRWVVPASIAATVLVALTIALALLPGKASAQEMLATTLKANEEYKGWVHLTYGKDAHESLHWNTQDGTNASRAESGRGTTIFFADAQAGEIFCYSSASGVISKGILAPDRIDPDRKTPLSFPALLERLRTVSGQDTVKISQSTDRAMDRFDLTFLTNPAQPLPAEFQEGAGSLGRPSTVWVDPKTKLIAAAIVDGQEISLTYGGPEIHSIYEAGAPKEAKVVDNRPTPEALAAVRRVRARIERPFPDGVAVKLTYAGPHINLQVYDRAGPRWLMRQYPATTGAVEHPALQIPEHWQDAGADEFFRRLAATMPSDEEGGDGTKAWQGEFDPVTGEEFLTYGTAVMGDNGVAVSTSQGRIPGRQEYFGRTAQSMERIYAPARNIYPQETNAAFSTDNHLDLITAPDRPGQVAFRVLFPDQEPGTLRFISQEWFDPTHGDRPVTFQTLVFVNGKIRQMEYRQTTEFSEYTTLPAPDGRSYPTRWTQTTYDANNSVQSNDSTEFRFFSGRHLPEVPKKPSRP